MNPPNDDDSRFAPHAAADLLVRTRRDAARRFESRTPLVCTIWAVVVLAVYGLLWLSVRGQHPYTGPTAVASIWAYAIVACSSVVSVIAYRRAAAGVRGRSRRVDGLAWLAVGVPWIAVYVFNGALQSAGFDDRLIYGIFDAAGPWLVVGAAVAGFAAGRDQRGGIVTGLTIVLIGTVAAFFGPANCWGVLAIAGCAALLALAVSRALHLRHA